MDTFYNWNQIRGLALLAILGLFVMYALLAASLQNWHGRRRTPRITKQDSPLSAKPTKASTGGSGATEPSAWRDTSAARSIATTAR